MIFLHVADLHLGKVVNDFSMLEDQKFILEQICGMAKENHADAVVIAGDIYDRAIPPGEAVTLLDSFLNALTALDIQVIMISGNHDSPERISFGENLLGRQGVHISGMYKEELTKIVFKEEAGETEFVLLPFVKPAQLGGRTSGEAVERMLEGYWQGEDKKKPKNRVLVTHFFVTHGEKEPELSDSETTIHVGGLDNVDASLFQGFDYVALGHIHKPQQIGEGPVWYAGAPLKYSFGEVSQTKKALLVRLGGKGLEEVKPLPLRPMREMRKIEGSLKEVLEGAIEDSVEKSGQYQDYIQAILTDEGELIDPIGTIRSVYPNVMQIVRKEAERTSDEGVILKNKSRMLAGQRDVLSLFEAFYQEVRKAELTDESRQAVTDIVKELEGNE